LRSGFVATRSDDFYFKRRKALRRALSLRLVFDSGAKGVYPIFVLLRERFEVISPKPQQRDLHVYHRLERIEPDSRGGGNPALLILS
jgi:hypothetical protein